MTNRKSDQKSNNKNKSSWYLPPLKRRDFLRGSAGGMAGAWLSAWPWQKLAAQQDLNPVTDDWDSGIVRLWWTLWTRISGV